MRRNELLKLYEWKERIDPKTGKTVRESVYVGPVYTPVTDNLPAARRHALRWCLLSLAGVILAGFAPALSTRTSWVMLPFLAVLLALCFCLAALWELRKTSTRLNEIQKRDGLDRLRVWTVILLAAGCLWVLAEAVFIVRNRRYIRFGGDGVFLLGALLCALGAVLMWRSVRGIEVKEQDVESNDD